MVLCLVISCGNKTRKKRSNVEKVRFFRVPRVIVNQGEYTKELTSERRRMWISAISREDLTDDILDRDRVCSQHFVSGEAAKDWDRFNGDWVPTLHLGHSKQHVKDPEKAAARAQRAANRRKRRAEIAEKEVEEKGKQVDDTGETADEIFYEAEPEAEALSVDDKDPETKKELYESHDQKTMNAETQTPESGVKIIQNAETQTTEFEYLFKQAVLQPFTEEYFADHDDRVTFYTGLSGFDVLKATFSFISPFVTRRSKSLSLFQEFIMVVMKLRLNVPPQDLAYRFGISLSTVSRTFSTWLTVMDIRLSPIIRWPERDELWHTMPLCFQFSFGKKTTVIIDCFEIFIERPSNLLARAQTFSNYKHHNTVKVLIAITPQGSICFTSKAWGGRTSDKYLTDKCGLLNHLKTGELVMADQGFTIHESVALYQAQLAIPAFTRGKNQLEPLDVERTRGITNVRIHVKRVIRLLRQKYSILQGILLIDYLTCSEKSGKIPLIDRMIRVCAALTNLFPSVVPFE